MNAVVGMEIEDVDVENSTAILKLPVCQVRDDVKKWYF